MHVIFSNYHYLVDSSGIHIHFLANELEKLGVACTVCIPEEQQLTNIFGPALYRLVQFHEMTNLAYSDRLKMRFSNSLLHAWTPRENVRRFTQTLAEQLSTSYFLHLEDNEEQILSSELKMSYTDICQMPEDELSLPLNVIHPYKYEQFLQNAIGVSCIIQTLESFIPSYMPRQIFWPACEPEVYNIPYKSDLQLRNDLGFGETDFLISYTGNMHKSNAEEINTLYRSIGLLNENGQNVKLIRTGTNTCDFLTDISEIQSKFVHELGTQPAAEIRKYLAAADALVQPGSVNAFNNYRFPSKLPMYFASGRPVILPPANIGNYVIDGKECLHIQNGSVEELADKISILINNPELRLELGTAGRAFARENFSWEKSAKQLLSFYESSLRLHRKRQIKRIFSLPFFKTNKIPN